jgi:hypothetical protein
LSGQDRIFQHSRNSSVGCIAISQQVGRRTQHDKG